MEPKKLIDIMLKLLIGEIEIDQLSLTIKGVNIDTINIEREDDIFSTQEQLINDGCKFTPWEDNIFSTQEQLINDGCKFTPWEENKHFINKNKVNKKRKIDVNENLNKPVNNKNNKKEKKLKEKKLKDNKIESQMKRMGKLKLPKYN